MGRSISFTGTLTVNTSTSVVSSYVAQRSTYTSLTVVSYPDLLPPSSFQSNTNAFPGVVGSIDIPFLTAGTPLSAYKQTVSGSAVTEVDAYQGWSTMGSFSSSSGKCINYAAASFFYPAAQPQVACLSYTAISANGSIVAHVSAQLTFDSSRVFANPYDYSGQPYSGWKLLAASGSRIVSMTLHLHSAVSSFSLSSSNGTLAQWSLFNFVSATPTTAINLLTAPFAWPDNTTAWSVSTPAVTGLQWNGTGLIETGTGYSVSAFSLTTQCVAPTPSMTPPIGLTAACLSGYWADTASQYNGVNLAYALTVLYNASVTAYNATLQAYYNPIVSIVGTRTVSNSSGGQTVQYLTLLPSNVYLGSSTSYYPTSNQLQFRSLAFTAWPTSSGTGSNVIGLTVSSSAYQTYGERAFLSGGLSVIPLSPCYSYAAAQATYYNLSQLVTYSFALNLSNATTTASITGSLTVDIGHPITSLADLRPMYRITNITGQHLTTTAGLTLILPITGLVAGGSHQNLLYLPVTDFISGPQALLFDVYGATYAAGGMTYTLTNASATQVRQVDNNATMAGGYLGNSTLCMGGLACPLVYPLQVCLRYSAVDTTGAYGQFGASTLTSSMQATATVQSSGLVTSLQGVRMVLADPTNSGTPTSFLQYVSLLPAGSSGNTNLLLSQAPYLDTHGLSMYTTPAGFTLSSGLFTLRLASSSSFNVTEDAQSAMLAPSLSVTGGACTNLPKVSWFYPAPAPIPISLSYTFAYPPGSATSSGMVVQTSLSLHVDGSGSDTPVPSSSFVSQGFLVLDASGSRSVTHYTNGVVSRSSVAQVTSVLAADSYDGFANANLLFLLSLDQSTFGLAFNTTGTDSTGTAGGLGGAVALRWNASQQLYQEVASLALGTLTISVNASSAYAPSTGLAAACVTGSFIDTTGTYGYTHVSYSLTLLYNPMASGTDNGGQYFSLVDMRGTRTAHLGGTSSVNYVNLVAPLGLNNDNKLYTAPSAAAFFSGSGVGFTTDRLTPYTYGYSGLSLAYNPNSGLFTESYTNGPVGLTGRLALLPNATCPSYPNVTASFYPPSLPVTLNWNMQAVMAGLTYVVTGNLTVDASRLVLSLTGALGYPMLSAYAGIFIYSSTSESGQTVYTPYSTSSLTLSPAFQLGNTNMLYFPSATNLSNLALAFSSNNSSLVDALGVMFITAGAVTVQLYTSAGQSMVLQQGLLSPVNFCLWTTAAPSSSCPSWVPPPPASSSSGASSSPASSSPLSSSLSSSAWSSSPISSSVSSSPLSSSLSSSLASSSPSSSASSSLSSSLASSSASSSVSSAASSLPPSSSASSSIASSSTVSSSAPSSAFSSSAPSSSLSVASSSAPSFPTSWAISSSGSSSAASSSLSVSSSSSSTSTSTAGSSASSSTTSAFASLSPSPHSTALPATSSPASSSAFSSAASSSSSSLAVSSPTVATGSGTSSSSSGPTSVSPPSLSSPSPTSTSSSSSAAASSTSLLSSSTSPSSSAFAAVSSSSSQLSPSSTASALSSAPPTSATASAAFPPTSPELPTSSTSLQSGSSAASTGSSSASAPHSTSTPVSSTSTTALSSTIHAPSSSSASTSASFTATSSAPSSSSTSASSASSPLLPSTHPSAPFSTAQVTTSASADPSSSTSHSSSSSPSAAPSSASSSLSTASTVAHPSSSLHASPASSSSAYITSSPSSTNSFNADTSALITSDAFTSHNFSASTSSSPFSTSSSSIPWRPVAVPLTVQPTLGTAASTAFNFSVDKQATLRLLVSDASDSTLFAFPLSYVMVNSTASLTSDNFTISNSSAQSSAAVVVAELADVDSVVVFLPAGLLLFTLCAQPSSTSALVIGGCVTYNTAVQVSLPYSADSNTSVVSCYLSSAVASVSSSSSSGSLSVQDLSLLSALATTAVQSSASLTLCPTDNNTTAAAGDGGVSGGSGGNVTGPASVSSRILAILGNGTAGLLRSAASSSSPTAALSTAALLAQTLATVTSGYTNASSAASPRAAGNGSDSSSGSASVGSALLSSSVSTPVGVTPMTQATFDTASAVVGLLLAALQQAAAATSTSNGSSTAATSTSSSSSTSFTSSAQQANVAVASVLGNLVQASQAALSSSSSGSSSGADSSTEDDDEQAAQLQAACARFVTSSAQVQQLVNATLQQAQAGANTSAPGTLLTTQPLSTAAFSAQAFQLTAEPSSSSSSSNSSNASSSLGGVGLSVPAGELPWTSAGSSCVSVRVVQVSGQWALCGGGQQLSSGSASAGSPSSSPATAPTLSSNMVSIDVTDAAGTAMAVSGLQQPIEFDLVASLPSGLGGLVDTSSLSPVNVSAALSGLLPTCSWYDPVLLSWSTAGCNSSVSSLTSDAVSVHCSCSHLTDFGIIYAMAGSGDGLAAITTGFPGYLVLLVVYIVLWLLTLVQLTRILNIADSAWVTERWSRLRAPLITSKDRMAGMHSTRRTSSLSSASQLVLLEHVLVFVMTTCRACSMCILYRYDSSVSFAALSGLSLLPLVLNEWVYGFVIFQWSAIYLNAVRGGGVGECDFASSSMLRLRVAFYLTMSVVSLCVVGLYVGVVLCEGEAAVQQQLAYAGILLTLCFIALLASLLFTLGLALVYSLTRDFASRHATKLFLIAATFSCTLLGQAMTLLHQAAQPNSIRDNLNTDDMFYYSLDAAGHALVLYMFKRSVRNAEAERRKQRAHAFDSVHSELHGAGMSVRGHTSLASAADSSIKDKMLREVQLVRPSFHDQRRGMRALAKVGHSRSSSASVGVSGIASSHVQISATGRTSVAYHTRVWSTEQAVKGLPKGFSFNDEPATGVAHGTDSMLEMEEMKGEDAWQKSSSSSASPSDGGGATAVSPRPVQSQVELDREQNHLFIHTRGRLVLPPLQSAPGGSASPLSLSPLSPNVELQLGLSSSLHRRNRSVAPLPISPRSTHSRSSNSGKRLVDKDSARDT